ncbi:hypothetical protein OB919_11020 [Halobacteria archaeon AArc-curdl1]|uniref:Peptidase M10 metallopeptidase domain-containing protein n=1 Tax=Natronosalvus hydrolyticus TaxID=2979988 RepID=A0AAP3E7S0_9EURY|nr:hypothetical protein [Halobacteria archaeon AArc-curdl1]
MKRRELLGACAACAPMVAGCTSPDALPEEREPRHPLADQTVSVRIENRSDTDHDVETNARDALAYWETHAEQYVGFGVDFEVVTDDPQLTIAYVDTPEDCQDVEGYSELVLGCAPLLRPGNRLPNDLTAYVVAANRPFGKVRITTKHEIGHVLGLYHDDEPREIMSNRPEDRIPLYDVRINIWETVLEAQERSNDGTRLYSDGITNWNEDEYAVAAEAFNAAHDELTTAEGLVDAALDLTDAFDGHPSVETVALEALRNHLTRLRERMHTSAALTRAMEDASVAADEGDFSRANDHLSAANAHIREINTTGVVELRDIAVALGLVRGFDRDEPVVDIDEDEVE